MKHPMIAAAGAAYILLAGCSSTTDTATAPSDGRLPHGAVTVHFNDQGQALLPRGYRSWVHAATSWSPIGKTPISPDQPTKTPELHNVYVEPSAYRTYMKTGHFPEGAVLVKEFSKTDTNPLTCSGPPAFVCLTTSGKNIMDHGETGIAVMYKNTQRYPKAPGGWAYFDFGHQPPPYRPVSAPHPFMQCAACHVALAGPSHDYVFSTDRPGLSRKGNDAKENLAAAFAGE